MLNVKSIISSVYKDVTSHWKHPAPGNFVSYKEMLFSFLSEHILLIIHVQNGGASDLI